MYTLYLPRLCSMVGFHIPVLHVGKQRLREVGGGGGGGGLVNSMARVPAQVPDPPALPTGGGALLPGARASSEAHCVLVFSTK